MYAFHPGQNEICHFQNLPNKDLGLASYFALNLQFSHCDSAMISKSEFLFISIFKKNFLGDDFFHLG
jgi:hypothetical protein